MWPGTGTCTEGFATRSQNRGASPQGRQPLIKAAAPSVAIPPIATVGGHGASIEVIAPAAIGIEREAIPGVIAVSAGVPALVVVVIAGPAAIHVFAAGIGVERPIAAPVDVFAARIGVELGHAAAEIFAAGIGVELGHAAPQIFAARIGVDASRFGHGYRADQH